MPLCLFPRPTPDFIAPIFEIYFKPSRPLSTSPVPASTSVTRSTELNRSDTRIHLRVTAGRAEYTY